MERPARLQGELRGNLLRLAAEDGGGGQVAVAGRAAVDRRDDPRRPLGSDLVVSPLLHGLPGMTHVNIY